MRKILVVALLLSVGCKARHEAGGGSETKFYGGDNTRFQMRFESFFYMAPTTDETKIKTEAYESLKYLMGVFQWHKEFAESKGITRNLRTFVFGNPKFVIKDKVTEDYKGTSLLKVTYVYDDEVVFGKAMKRDTVEFWMPKYRPEAWELGKVDGKNRCTDYLYQGQGDYWYFWNPDMPGKVEKDESGAVTAEAPGCPAALLDGLTRVQASLVPIPSTTKTFPEYGRLGSKTKKVVYLAQGVNEKIVDDDAGVVAFQAIQKLLDGTTELPKSGNNDIEDVRKLTFQQTSVVVDDASSKRFLYSTTIADAEVELHLGLFVSGKPEFNAFVKEGLENADLFIYNGHSGLGGYLRPAKFEPLRLPTKYQVFLFNGCSTFAYYNEDYFNRKRQATGRDGMCDLDIVTTGLESYFAVNPYVSINLLKNLVVSDKHWTWQSLINDLYWQTQNARYGADNQYGFDPKKYSAHYHVNGDELNPTELDAALRGEPGAGCK